MSGSNGPHLQRRNGIFHLRVMVPTDIRLLIGLTEVRRSLRTCAPLRARSLAARYAERLFGVFAMLKKTDFTRETAIALVQGCFADLLGEVDKVPPLDLHSPYVDAEERRFYATSAIATFSRQRTAQNFEPSGDPEFCIIAEAHALAAARGYDFDQLPAARQLDLLDGVARAFIEQQRLLLLRLDDRLSPFQPIDPLFAGEINVTASPLPPPVAMAFDVKGVGPSVGDAIWVYLKSGEKKWTDKTLASRKVRLGYLEQHLGSGTALSAVTADDIREFRDGICRMRRNHGRVGKQTFLEKQTSNEAHRIEPRGL